MNAGKKTADFERQIAAIDAAIDAVSKVDEAALNVKAGDGGYDQELALRMNGLILTTPMTVSPVKRVTAPAGSTGLTRKE